MPAHVAQIGALYVPRRDSPTVSPLARSRVANLSARGLVGHRGEPMIVGFVTAGSRPHRILVRAAGPALSALGVANVLNDPSIAVFDAAGVPIVSNGDWSAASVASAAASVGGFPFPAGSRDSALVSSFAPGAYTANVTGEAGATGIAVVEGYDLEPGESAVRLINISTRGVVGVNGENLSAGLVVGGETPRRVLVRAIGPSLRAFGIGDALSDPVLLVYDSARQLIHQSDDWSDAPHSAHIAAAAEQVGAFLIARDTSDAAVLAFVPPGAYTFIIASKNGEAGTALLEVYDLD